jgi:hypothetical protein
MTGVITLCEQFTQQLVGNTTFRAIGGELFITDAETKNTMKFIRARF